MYLNIPPEKFVGFCFKYVTMSLTDKLTVTIEYVHILWR